MAEVVDLCDSDNEVAVTFSAVARMPSPRSRARMNLDDDDDDVVEVTFPRKRARSALKSEQDVEVVQVQHKDPPPPSPLQQVLSIFPDVEISHAKKLLKEHKDQADHVINALIEGGDYPKEKKNQKQAAPGGVAGLFKMKSSSTEKTATYDFLSESSFQPTTQYIKESIVQLQHFFPCFTKSGVTFIMKRSGNHFAIAHNKIVRILKCGDGPKPGDEDEEIRQYKRLKACTDNKVRMLEHQKKEFQTIFGCEPRASYFSAKPKAKHAQLTDLILSEEVSFVREKLRTWVDGIENEIARRENREISIKDGTALECACCYEQVSMDEMVQCRNEGHLFCQDCLSNYVENQVFSNGNFGCKPGTKELATELMCFHGDGCGSGFDRYFLEKALKTKVLDRYDELQSQVNLEQAGLRETICTCPICGFTAEVPATQAIFSCLNVECGFESCRKCREASHIPLRCDEVEKKHEEEGRTRVEEAASAAVIRSCPSCSKGILKEDGCNKMTCPCGTKFCYMCRSKVKDYSHFCQVAHCDHSDPRKCKNKCPLYTKDLKELHEKNMREAALAEAARVEAEGAKTKPQEKVAGFFGDDGDSKPAAKVAVDVEKILQAPAKRRRAH